MKIAVYPGSFDPITLGHLNVIKRAARLFDKLYICVAINSAKKYAFTTEERVRFVEAATKKYGNVEVVSWDGLIVDLAKEIGAGFIVKGLRAVSDFDMEFQIALVNKRMAPNIETVFLTAEEKYTYLSSTVAREFAIYNADLSGVLPREIIDDVLAKLRKDI